MDTQLKKIDMAALPTPIVELKRISGSLGKRIWIKRDDLTGIELSGNKVRKLEYIFYDILEKKCDYVITCGGKQSNHCRAVAAAAAKFGVKCVLVLSGQDNGVCDGNLFLDRLLGAETVFIDQSKSMDEEMQKESDRLTLKGHKPYVIPLGGSNPLGSAGYVDAYGEITTFEHSHSVRFDSIVLAVGSGGTYAGLLAGNEKSNDKKKINGISVLAPSSQITDKILEICGGMDLKIDRSSVNITDNYIGEGYGIASVEVIEFLKEMAVTEGILLDPVYTGKAFYGLKKEIQRGAYDDCGDILFMHTGGIFGTFGQIGIFGL